MRQISFILTSDAQRTVIIFIELFPHAQQQLLTIAGICRLLDDFDQKTADSYFEHNMHTVINRFTSLLL